MNTPQQIDLIGKIPEVIELEKALRKFDAKNLLMISRLSADDMREFSEISDEGLAYFKDAAKDTAPLQNLILGVSFTIWALEQCRKVGPIPPN
jgi:hypothetical protein